MNTNKKFLHNEHGDLNTVNAGMVIVLFLVLLWSFAIAISTMNNIRQAHSTASSDKLYDTQQAVVSATESSYNTMDILHIIMVVATVIAALLTVLFIFRRRKTIFRRREA